MNTPRKLQLESLIADCSYKLEKLKPHLGVSDVTGVMYNKILIQKAVYLSELKELNASFFRKLLKSVKTLNPSAKYKICDYFK